MKRLWIWSKHRIQHKQDQLWSIQKALRPDTWSKIKTSSMETMSDLPQAFTVLLLENVWKVESALLIVHRFRSIIAYFSLKCANNFILLLPASGTPNLVFQKLGRSPGEARSLRGGAVVAPSPPATRRSPDSNLISV